MTHMSDPPATRGTVDIRPVQPVGVWSAGAPGGLRTLSKRLRLLIDPSAGLARWTTERRRTVELPLRGSSSGRSLERVVVVTAGCSALFGDNLTRRIVFVDGAGRSMVSSVQLGTEGFDLLWPRGIFDPLRDLGIAVESQEERNQHQLNRAFPGASRHWRMLTFPWNWMIAASWVVVPAFIFLLLIGYGIVD
jgi:hypothetical protein